MTKLTTIQPTIRSIFMPSVKSVFLLTFVLIFLQLNTAAQQKSFSNFTDLSRFSFAKQKDSLKKAWACPAIYKDKKTQNKYAEIWNGRTSFLLDAIEGNNYVYHKEIEEYINSIINEIAAGNKNLVPVKPLLLIDRSESVNAYAVGGNVIAVNLGLISFANSREELALIIAHELSHNILTHTENAMQQKAEMLTSDEYNASLKDVLNSKYGRLTKLKDILASYSFSRSKHSRYKEADADSLAIILLGNTKIPFNAAYYLRLDSADNEYKTALLKSPKEYFTVYNFNPDEQWFVKKSKGLSTRNYNFKQSDALADSLKTHPECVERFEATKAFTTAGAKFTPVPASLQDAANKLIVWNLYNNMSLTPALYRILLLKDKKNTDTWYDVMVYNIFAGLYYADKKLARFNAIGVVPKEYISKEYFALQNLLEQIPATQLKTDLNLIGSLPFWAASAADSKGFKLFLASLITEEELSKKQEERLSKEFIANYPTSLYAEIADKFK